MDGGREGMSEWRGGEGSGGRVREGSGEEGRGGEGRGGEEEEEEEKAFKYGFRPHGLSGSPKHQCTSEENTRFS